MATLARDVAIARTASNRTIQGPWKATAAIFAGAILVRDGTQVDGVKKATGTTGFKGIALSGAAAAGETVDVLEVGYVETPINATVAASNEDDTVYANTSGASDNLEDCNLTSTSNLSIGKIAAVLVAGAAGANLVRILIEGDGHTSR